MGNTMEGAESKMGVALRKVNEFYKAATSNIVIFKEAPSITFVFRQTVQLDCCRTNSSLVHTSSSFDLYMM